MFRSIKKLICFSRITPAATGFLLLSACIAFLPMAAKAQPCLPSFQYQDAPYWQATSVFTGKVEETPSEPLSDLVISRPRPYRIKFGVEKSYRGDIEKNVEFTSNYPLQVGERYFVYAVRGNDGKLYLLGDFNCSPSILLKDAGEDIQYIEDLKAGKLGTRIYGYTLLEKQESFRSQRTRIPLPEIEVRIKSERDEFATKTDANGRYLFKDIPPGAYKVSASAPTGTHDRKISNNWQYGIGSDRFVYIGETINAGVISVPDPSIPKKFYRHWDSYTFLFSPLSKIEGRIIDSEGNIPPQQYLYLIPIDETGKAYLGSPIQYLWMNPQTGEFTFDNVPKGKYLIAINRFNCNTPSTPEYGRNFYPGAFNQLESETITVGENQNIHLNDFRLLPALKERWISGVVLAADHTPLANANVFMHNRTDSNVVECFSFSTDVKTDQNGRFRIKGYEGYAYELRAYITTQNSRQTDLRQYAKMVTIPDTGNFDNVELIIDPQS